MKITVIGAAGRMGSMHARHLIELGHEVYGVDPRMSWPDARIQEAHGIADGSDAVVIATPADRHIDDIERALACGCHVFVEKPICLIGQTEPMRKILELAQTAGIVVATGYNLRFHPAVVSIKDAITAGHLQPLWGSFLLRQKPVRPVVHFLEEWASHEVDLALHLMGPWGDVKVLPHDTDEMRIAIIHALGHEASFIHVDAVPEPFRRAFTIVDQEGASVTCDIEQDHVQDGHYRAELAAWLDQIYHEKAIREGKQSVGDGGPLASGWDGLAVIELLEKLTK